MRVTAGRPRRPPAIVPPFAWPGWGSLLRGMLRHRLRTPRLSSMLVLASLVLAPVPAAAQPAKQDPAAMAEAKKQFERGLKLYKEGLFREALSAFQLAKQASPRESIQRNIAQCHRELKEFAAAHDAYTELLDTYGAKMKTADVDVVKRALEELRILTGTVKVTVGEPGARVTIGEREVGTTPLAKPVRLNIGSYKVTVAKAGFNPISRQVELHGGDELVVDGTLTRESQTGKVAVTAEGEVAGAKLYVDGNEVSATLPWEGELPPGSHELEARSETAGSEKRRIEVTKGTRLEIALKLEARIARVVVEAGRADARILIDGKLVGTGAWEGTLAPGKHELLVEADGYESVHRVILPRAGDSLAVRDITLTRIGGAAPPPVLEHDYKGLYTQIHLLGLLPSKKHQFATDCPTSTGATCELGAALGGGLGLRIGYSLGVIGIEGFLLGSYDRSAATVRYPLDVPAKSSPEFQGVARTEDYVVHRYGGSGGVAVRATSQHETIRFTSALGAGLSMKKLQIVRDAKATKPEDADNAEDSGWKSNTAGYVAPTMVLDAGLLLGATPGAKFHLGALVAFDFLADPVTTNADDTRTLGVRTATSNRGIAASPDPTKSNRYLLGTPSLIAAGGTQTFIGVVLGMQVGE